MPSAPGGTSIGALLRSYTWGLDIALSMSNAGGVGALLQIADHPSGKTFFPTYDGNGNVASLVNADTGALAAIYEYSPFGEPLRAQTLDLTIADNPFRFSTKYCDLETGLVYYGRRYYDPRTGRFVCRDPKEESGGLNLYGFCHNDGVNHWDYLGMEEYGSQGESDQEGGGDSGSASDYVVYVDGINSGGRMSVGDAEVVFLQAGLEDMQARADANAEAERKAAEAEAERQRQAARAQEIADAAELAAIAAAAQAQAATQAATAQGQVAVNSTNSSGRAPTAADDGRSAVASTPTTGVAAIAPTVAAGETGASTVTPASSTAMAAGNPVAATATVNPAAGSATGAGADGGTTTVDNSSAPNSVVYGAARADGTGMAAGGPAISMLAMNVTATNLAPQGLTLGEIASATLEGIKSVVSPTYKPVDLGGSLGFSASVGNVALSGSLNVGMYVTRQEYLYGAKAGVAVEGFGVYANAARGYEFGVDNKLTPIDRPINTGGAGYKMIDPLNLTFSSSIKTPVGTLGIKFDLRPVFGIKPNSGSGG